MSNVSMDAMRALASKNKKHSRSAAEKNTHRGSMPNVLEATMGVKHEHLELKTSVGAAFQIEPEAVAVSTISAQLPQRHGA
jgi:hypothetical protein